MTIDLGPLLADGIVFDVLSSESRKEILCELSNALAEKLDLDARVVFEAIMERENLGSTGVGHGVAIPHARMDGLNKPVGAFVRLTEGVDFDAIDGVPCDLIFMLIAPNGAGADHLRALAQVSRAFRHADLREALRSAEDKAGLLAKLCPTSLAKSAA